LSAFTKHAYISIHFYRQIAIRRNRTLQHVQTINESKRLKLAISIAITKKLRIKRIIDSLISNTQLIIFIVLLLNKLIFNHDVMNRNKP